MNANQKNLLAGAIVALLAITMYGVISTSADPAPTGTAAPATADSAPVLNEASMRMAQALVRLPTTADEAASAQDALKLADQEMDMAFAEAVREATAHPAPMSAEAKGIQARVEKSERARTNDSTLVAQLSASATRNAAANDQLSLAKARLELDDDELDDARDDLIHAGGDPRGRMQAMVQEHEAASRSSDSTHIKITPLTNGGGLVQIAQSFSQLRSKDLSLRNARHAADSAASALAAQHRTLDAAAAKASADTTAVNSATLLADTQRRALEQKSRSSAEERGHLERRLAGVYSKWRRIVKDEERVLMNRGFRGVMLILFIALAWLFFDSMLTRFLSAFTMERRSLQTLRLVSRVSLQILSVLLVFIIILGVPSNLGTIVGLAGAGLTVALKDFIVGFIGWFVLMGKNGLRIGDLVEINGVTGEVVELGMFNTVLHETGNWTDANHPTGRRVTFTNSYAIEGHYFNFSTSRQWLWDEVRIVVPGGTDPYAVVESLKTHVQQATAESAKLAEQEWKGASRSPGSSSIATAPGITLKPVVGGVELTVRYITHAAERYQVRSQLYHTAVGVLGEAKASGR